MLLRSVGNSFGQHEAASLGIITHPFRSAGEKGNNGAGKRTFQNIDLVIPLRPELPDKSDLGGYGTVTSPAIGMTRHGVPKNDLVHVGNPLNHIG